MKANSITILNVYFYFLFLYLLVNGCASKKDLARIEEQLVKKENAIKELQKDSDADGVPDFNDLEPNSPLGARVDTKGITLDSDGDGIPDYLDLCPFVPGPASNDGCIPDESVEMPSPSKRDDEFWPIPKPTNFDTVTDEFFGLSEKSTLEEVYIQIRSRINEKDKKFNKIMKVPMGFALFTKLERINESGLTVKDPITIESCGCSIAQIVPCLFGAPSGRYRFFAFIVSGISEIGMAIEDTEYSKVVQMISNGYDYNKSYLRTYDNEPIYFSGYEIHLIVYEYETYPGSLPKLVTDSNINHHQHIF